MQITRGTLVEVRTANGEQVRMRALGVPTRGRDFPVLWVCTEIDYADDLPESEGIPWPVDAVRLPETV